MQFSTIAKASGVAMQWTAVVSCVPTPHALCREGVGLVYFPDNVVDMPYDLSVIPTNSVLSYFPHGSCTGRSGRRIVVGDEQYEVSLCDLLDANMDIILDTTMDQLRWRVDATNTTEYIFVSVVCVYLMSCISANVVRFSGHDGFKITRIELVVLVVTIIYISLNMFCDSFGVWFGGLRYLLTSEDTTLAVLIWVYVVCETIVVAGPVWRETTENNGLSALWNVWPGDKKSGGPQMVSGVSVYTGLILLLTLRVHYTFDNPYLHVLVVMFGTRTFQKLSSLHIVDSQNKCMLFIVALDAVCFSALLALAVGPAAGNVFEAVLSQVTIATISMLFATAIETQGELRDSK